jgi:hypothetical protein
VLLVRDLYEPKCTYVIRGSEQANIHRVPIVIVVPIYDSADFHQDIKNIASQNGSVVAKANERIGS